MRFTMYKYPEPLSKLIHYLKKLPGVGVRTAERFAFQMLEWENKSLEELGSLLSVLQQELTSCTECGALKEKKSSCSFCDPYKRDMHVLCIIPFMKDLYAMEKNGFYKGTYHVLGSLLSPLEKQGEKEVNLQHLLSRIQRLQVQEIILAFDSTLESDATALYLREKLQPTHSKISRLAFGLPLGSPLEHVDASTLMRAFSGRLSF